MSESVKVIGSSATCACMTVVLSAPSGPTVQSEYLSATWGADIENIRRAKSGAVASDVYNNKIVAERSYMQSSNTRVVTFEMCGNDGLQARTAFKDQTGTCNYNVLETAVQNYSGIEDAMSNLRYALQLFNGNGGAEG